MTDSPGWASPDAPGPDDPSRTPQPTPPPAGQQPQPGEQAPPPNLQKTPQQPPQAPAGWSPQQPPPAAPGWGQGWQSPGAGPQQPGGAPAWGPPGGWGGPYRQAAKPGVIPLRPLSVGEILDGAFSALRSHWRVMVGFAAVVALLIQVIQVPVDWFVYQQLDTVELSDEPTSSEVREYFSTTLGAMAAPAILGALAQLVVTGMLTVVMGRAVLGKGMTVSEAWKSTRPLLLRLIGVTLLSGLLVVLAVFVCMLPGILLAVADGGSDGAAALLLLGLVVGLCLMVYLYVSLSLAGPTLMLEKQTVVKALRRSHKLVKGSWWRIFGILLLVMIITTIVTGIVTVPFSLLSGGSDAFSTDTSSVSDPSLWQLVVMAIGTVIASALVYPFSAGAGVLLYVDQRMRREALDLELARAAGLVADDTPGGAPGAAPGAGPAQL
jgi:hypothetical protein